MSPELLKRFYPDARCDGTEAFYGWVDEALTPQSHLLNLGAGPPTLQKRRILRGRVARVVGADVDPLVLQNPEVDESHLVVGGRLPFGDATFDVAVSDFVFEHVEAPGPFLAEARRVLRPGGSLFFRTPNRAGYVATIARLTPHWFHRAVANRARGLPEGTHDPWPTFYRMNRRRELEPLARGAGFARLDLRYFEPEPSYLMFNSAAFMLGVAFERVVSRHDAFRAIRTSLMGRLVA